MMTIKNVPQNDLCTGCGTCAGVCPFDAIVMEKSGLGLLLPYVDEKKCKVCGMCVTVCPGFKLDLDSLSKELDATENNSLLGKVYGSYWGYSNEDSIRFNCASGGLCTEILTYALENKIIDGAIVTRMSDNNPLETEPFIAKSKEDLLIAAKSKYCPVSTNKLLNFVKNQKGKFAVVGLPCHIHGIRKAQNVFPSLKEKIVLCLGLMCSHSVTYDGTEFLLEKLGFNKDSVSKIEYRGNGWPGSMQVSSALEGGNALILELDSTADLNRVQEIYENVLGTIANQALLIPVSDTREFCVWNSDIITGYDYYPDSRYVCVSGIHVG